MSTRLVAKWSAWAPHLLSLLRIVAAFMFMLGGTMKLFAFPTGITPDGRTVPLLSQIGLGAILEVFGGALLLLGLFTRPVAFLVAGVLYCFVWLYFSAAGAGPWSLDAKRSNWKEQG